MKAHPKWRTFFRRTWKTFLVIVLVLVAVRAVLPVVIQRVVNNRLDRKEGYSGRIGDVDLNLLRGAYEIEDVEIFKSSGKVPVPFFAAKKLDLSMQWSELFHGSLVGEIECIQGRMNFVDGPTEEQSQTKVDKEWAEILESLFPFKLNRFIVRQSEVHFQRLHSSPPVDVYLKDVFIVATNFTNARKMSTNLVAGIEGHALVKQGGQMRLKVALDPLAKHPTFDLNLEVDEVNLPQLNDFLKAYGKFDVERGKFYLATEIKGADGAFDGYIKTIFDDLDVLNFGKERKSKKITQLFWEALVGGAAQLLENQPKDRLAAKIPIKGRFDQMDVAVIPTIASLLKNAFVRALLPGVEGSVNLGSNQGGK